MPLTPHKFADLILYSVDTLDSLNQHLEILIMGSDLMRGPYSSLQHMH